MLPASDEPGVAGVFSEARPTGSQPRAFVTAIHAAPALTALRNPRRVIILSLRSFTLLVVNRTSSPGPPEACGSSPSPKAITVPQKMFRACCHQANSFEFEAY
jgi:hypothetical protein